MQKVNWPLDERKRLKEKEQERNVVVKSPPPPLRFVNWEIKKETGGPGTNLLPPPPLRFVNPSIRSEKVLPENNRTPLSPTREISEDRNGDGGNEEVRIRFPGRAETSDRVGRERNNQIMENSEKGTKGNKNKSRRAGRGRQKYN